MFFLLFYRIFVWVFLVLFLQQFFSLPVYYKYRICLSFSSFVYVLLSHNAEKRLLFERKTFTVTGCPCFKLNLIVLIMNTCHTKKSFSHGTLRFLLIETQCCSFTGLLLDIPMKNGNKKVSI